VSIFHGEGTFLDNQTLTIKPSRSIIRSKSFVIATGVIFEPLPPFEIDHRKIWDTTDAIQMCSTPESIAIVGSGKRAMTFADIFHFLGCQVTVITSEDVVLPDQDHEISSRYRKVLKEKNINLFLSTKVMDIELGKDQDHVELVLEAKKGVHVLKVAQVLVASKRQANVKGLGLGKIDLSLKYGHIPVDRNLTTSRHGVYAIGDVIGGKYAAHKAMKEGVSVAKQMTGEEVRINYQRIPMCLYTHPQIACIGLTQEEAEEKGEDVEIGYFPFAAGTRAAIFGQTEGIIKVVAERKYGEVLGVHIIGPQATELISLASLAMTNELSVRGIKEAVYAHPSFAENFLEAINDAVNMMERQ
jgi:dihydrolipoamide dehydrogenase